MIAAIDHCSASVALGLRVAIAVHPLRHNNHSPPKLLPPLPTDLLPTPNLGRLRATVLPGPWRASAILRWCDRVG